MILAFAENSIQLVPDGTLLFHVLVVLIMVGVLNRTLYRPVNKVLEERERQTKGRQEEAGKLLADVEQKLTRYERGLRDARTSAYQLLEQERTKELRKRDERLASVKEDVRRLIQDEKSRIDSEVTEARSALDVESKRSATEIGSRILRRPIS
jgi:F-type H+-transporting ATPase subunit b